MKAPGWKQQVSAHSLVGRRVKYQAAGPGVGLAQGPSGASVGVREEGTSVLHCRGDRKLGEPSPGRGMPCEDL